MIDAAYPSFDPTFVTETAKEYPVSINGKLRANILISLEAGEEEVRAIAAGYKVAAGPDEQGRTVDAMGQPLMRTTSSAEYGRTTPFHRRFSAQSFLSACARCSFVRFSMSSLIPVVRRPSSSGTP